MFQQQEQTLNVDPAKIEKQQQNTLKSYNIPDWIRLLNIYKINQNWKQVDRITLLMQNRFILKQSFWIRQIQQRINRLKGKNQQQIKLILKLISKAFQHGQYQQFAKKASDIIIKLYEQGKINISQAQIKLEYIISIFCWELKNGYIYFQKLRLLYILANKPNKIRQVYQREIKIPYQSIDVVFDEYKNWEKNEQELIKTKLIYDTVKYQAQQIHGQLQSKVYEKIRPQIRLCFYQKDITEQMYVQLLNMLPADKKLIIFKRNSKNGKYILKYLKELQILKNNQQQINQEYIRIIYNTLDNFKYKCLFLFALVRRINKHLLTFQDQDYLNSWGQKVIYFRNQIQKFSIQTDKIQQQQFFYTYWIQIQAYVIKDKQAIKNIFKSLQSQRYSINLYKKCSDGFICLGQIQQAKNILKNGVKNSKDKQKCLELQNNFETIFGNIKQIQQFHQKKFNQLEDHKRQRQKQLDQTSLKIQHQQKKRFHGDGNKTLYVKGIPISWKQKQIIQLFQHKDNIAEVRLVGKNKDFCYVDFLTSQIAQKQCNNNKHKEIKMYLSKPPKQYNAQQRTLFFCGLPNSANQQKIRQLLTDFEDTIEDIRLIKNQEGTKGYCYVQFNSLEAKEQIFNDLMKRKLVIDNKKILIQQCDSDRMKSKKMNTVIFLRGLAYKSKQSDVIQFFKANNIQNIKAVQIPKDDKNKSKGIGYVQFSKFKDYQNALDLKKGTILKRDFQILRSDRIITKKNQGPKQNQDFRKFLK